MFGLIEESQQIPAGLDGWAPGPYLAAVLSSIDRTRLSGYDLVVVMRARKRQLSYDQAELLADMVEVSHCADADYGRLDEAFEYAAHEIRAALTLTRQAARSELDLATDLRGRLPQVWEALHAGTIDVHKARVIADGTAHVPEETARDIADRVLDHAAGLTTGQLRARIQRLCVEADHEQAKKRYEQKVEQRRMISELTPDGTANLMGLDLPPHRVAAIRGQVETDARHLKQAGDRRTMDQLRADIFIDLLLGKKTGHKGSGGVITMTSSLETLASLVDKAVDIPGMGPVIADIGRQVLGDHPNAETRYAVRDTNGDLVAVGTPSRKATKTLRRFIEARDQTCAFIGCRMPATQCDIDHIQRWVDDGPTTIENGDPLCRHDHRAKDDGGWQLRRLPNGSNQWKSPLGHSYTTKPDRPP
jgi:hypothetical protein